MKIDNAAIKALLDALGTRADEERFWKARCKDKDVALAEMENLRAELEDAKAWRSEAEGLSKRVDELHVLNEQHGKAYRAACESLDAEKKRAERLKSDGEPSVPDQFVAEHFRFGITRYYDRWLAKVTLRGEENPPGSEGASRQFAAFLALTAAIRRACVNGANPHPDALAATKERDEALAALDAVRKELVVMRGIRSQGRPLGTRLA